MWRFEGNGYCSLKMMGAGKGKGGRERGNIRGEGTAKERGNTKEKQQGKRQWGRKNNTGKAEDKVKKRGVRSKEYRVGKKERSDREVGNKEKK